MRELAEHAAEAVEQLRAQLELHQCVGQIAGDGESAPLGQHVDLRRRREHCRGRFKPARVDVLLELLQLERGLADEAVQHAAPSRVVPA